MTYNRNTNFLALAIFTLLAYSCSDEDPIQSISCQDPTVFVLNEGLWGSNNASIDAYCGATLEHTHSSLFAEANGVPLGDAAVDMELISVQDERMLAVSLNGSGAVVFLDLSGHHIATLPLPGANPSPRQLCVGQGDYNTFLYVTDFRDSVYEINVSDITNPEIARSWGTGPAPEDVMVVGHKLYVVNSGLGIYRKDEPNASTLLTINLESGTVIGYTELGPNPTTLAYADNSDELYCLFNHYQVGEQQDSLGGIQRIQPNSGQVIEEWRIENRSFSLQVIDETEIAYIGPQGISKLDLETGESELVIESSFGPENALYSLDYNSCSDCLWYTNALDYQNLGQVSNTCINTELTAGLIPTKVLFADDCP